MASQPISTSSAVWAAATLAVNMWVTSCSRLRKYTALHRLWRLLSTYFYLQQVLFDANVDVKAGRILVRNDFGTLPGACFDFMSISICANPASTATLAWTVLPHADRA